MPAATSARSFSGESDAGPSVATIFVRRSGITRLRVTSEPTRYRRVARGKASQPGYAAR